MAGIDGLRFQVRDTPPSRTSKLEAVRSIVFSIVSADLRTRLTNDVFGSGEYFPTSVGAMDGIGRIVPIINEGNVFETAKAIRVASKDWAEIQRNRTWQGYWRYRVSRNDPLNVAVTPKMGFIAYDYFGRYLGTIGTYTSPAINAASGWKEYTYQVTSEAVKALYPTATYLRVFWERDDKGKARTQIARTRGPIDYTDVARLEASIGAVGDTYDSLVTVVGGLSASVTTIQATQTSQGTSIATLQTTVATQGASITTNATAITSVTGSVATLTTTVATLGGNVTTIASAQTTLAGSVASLSSTVSTQGGYVTVLQTSTTDLYNRTDNRLVFEAVSGEGRAQLSIFSGSGGVGVDIVGDVRIHGNLVVDGSINGEDKIEPYTIVTNNIYPTALNQRFFTQKASNTNHTSANPSPTDMSITVNKEIDGSDIDITANIKFACLSGSGDLVGYSQIFRDGALIEQTFINFIAVGTPLYTNYPILFTDLGVAHGSHVYDYRFLWVAGSAPTVIVLAGSVMKIEEVKLG